jgi:hypothetical protein
VEAVYASCCLTDFTASPMASIPFRLSADGSMLIRYVTPMIGSRASHLLSSLAMNGLRRLKSE